MCPYSAVSHLLNVSPLNSWYLSLYDSRLLRGRAFPHFPLFSCIISPFHTVIIMAFKLITCLSLALCLSKSKQLLFFFILLHPLPLPK